MQPCVFRHAAPHGYAVGFFFMNRFTFFIDGLNVYYSLKDFKRMVSPGIDYRWFDLKKYVSQFVKAGTLEDVFYFSAYVEGKSRFRRQNIYKKAIESTGIKTSFHHFRKCGRREEKQTDVDIAATMLKLAILDKYDTCVLVSGDSDFVPAIEAIKELCPKKRIAVLFPFNRRTTKKHYSKLVNQMIITHPQNIVNCKFPPEILLSDGSKIACPIKWL